MRKRIELEQARQAAGLFNDAGFCDQEALLNEYEQARGSVQERMRLLMSQIHSEKAERRVSTPKANKAGFPSAFPHDDELCATARRGLRQFSPPSAAGSLPQDPDPERLLLREELHEARRMRDKAREEAQAARRENFRLYGQVPSIYAGSDSPTYPLETSQRKKAEVEPEKIQIREEPKRSADADPEVGNQRWFAHNLEAHDAALQEATHRAEEASLRASELEVSRQAALREAALCKQAVAREGVQRQVLHHIEAQLAPLLRESAKEIKGTSQKEPMCEAELDSSWACNVMDMVSQVQGLLERSQALASQECKRAGEAEELSRSMKGLAADAASKACQQAFEDQGKQRQALQNMQSEMMQAFNHTRTNEAGHQLKEARHKAEEDLRKCEHRLQLAEDQRASLQQSELAASLASQRVLHQAEADLAAADARASFDRKRADEAQESMQQARRDANAQVLAASENMQARFMEQQLGIQAQLEEANARAAVDRTKLMQEEAHLQQARDDLLAAEAKALREASAHELAEAALHELRHRPVSARSSGSTTERRFEQLEAKMIQVCNDAFKSLSDNARQNVQPGPDWQRLLQDTQSRFELQMKDAAFAANEQQSSLETELKEVKRAAASECSRLREEVVERDREAEMLRGDLTKANKAVPQLRACRMRRDQVQKRLNKYLPP
jgi:hypothetical protein